jgi:hypothetical protein
VRAIGRLTKPREVDGTTVKGINFFEPGDSALLHPLQNPGVNIAGIRRADPLPDLAMFTPSQLSRQLRRCPSRQLPDGARCAPAVVFRSPSRLVRRAARARSTPGTFAP